MKYQFAGALAMAALATVSILIQTGQQLSEN